MEIPAAESVNLDLRIEQVSEAGRYYAIVFLQGSAVARHEFDLPADDACRQSPPVLAGAGRGAGPRDAPGAAEAAKRWGDLLFRKVFGGPVLVHFRQEQRQARRAGLGLRLRLWLTGAPDLACLPWELLYDASRRQFLLRDPDLSLVRCLDVAEPSGPLRVEPPLRVLVALASPADRAPLAGEEELRNIEEELGKVRRSGRVFLDWLRPATHEALDERLQECPWHVLHFIGHGGHGPGAPEGALVLEDRARRPDLLDGSEVADLLAACPDLRLVVLNACRGGRSAEADAFAGVAQALLLRGLPAVVAMQSDVLDAAGLAFARHFYRELARTGSVDRALAWARRGLSRRRFGLAWAAPVLFTLSPDGQVFDVSPPGAGTSPTGQGLEAAVVDPPPPGQGIEPTNRRSGRWLAAAAALATAGLVTGLLSQGISMPAVLKATVGSPLSPPRWKRPVPGKVDDVHCPPPVGVDLHFVLIEPRTFFMGSDKGVEETRPAHQVTLTQPYCLAVYETTQAQWEKVMGRGSNTSRVRKGDLPVTRVTWSEAQSFVRQLDAGSLEDPFFLPTEAQLEYAARAGVSADTEAPPEGSPRAGNCLGTAAGDLWEGVIPVGQLEPNAFGLYDMVGNVWEWAADGYASYTQEPVTDPRVPDTGKGRVRRGGSFRSAADRCTSLTRGNADPTRRSFETGFRIARKPVNLPAPGASGPP